MSLLGWFRAKRDAKVIETHVETLVARNINLVYESIERKIAGLAQAEARGYIRAIATKLLADAIALASSPPTRLPVIS